MVIGNTARNPIFGGCQVPTPIKKWHRRCGWDL